MQKTKLSIVESFARMWPREVFDFPDPDGRAKQRLVNALGDLNSSGVYVLYRDDSPHYVGKADNIAKRLWAHANVPSDRYYYFWNYFSALVIKDRKHRAEVEGILIAAMPTANNATPKLMKCPMPRSVIKLLHQIRRSRVKFE